MSSNVLTLPENVVKYGTFNINWTTLSDIQNTFISTSWTSTNPSAFNSNNTYQFPKYVEDLELFIVCGRQSGQTTDQILYSTDGLDWTTAEVNGFTNEDWYRTVWSPELQILVANSRNGPGFAYSRDGTVWTVSTLPVTPLNSDGLDWSPKLGLFCVTSQTHSFISSNGINWSTYELNDLRNAVVWSPELGIFCASGSSGQTGISSDGINWVTQLLDSGKNFYDIKWSPKLGLFALACWNLKGVYVSSDGINWESNTIPDPTTGSNYLLGLEWLSNLELFVANGSSGYDNKIIYSNNGILWQTFDTNTGPGFQCWGLAYKNPDIIVQVSSSYSAKNIPDWSLYNTATNIGTPALSDVTITGSNMNIGSSANNVTISSNSEIIIGSSGSNISKTSGFIQIGNDNSEQIKYIIDGQITTESNWTTYDGLPVISNWRSVVWSPELEIFVASGQAGTAGGIMYSYDGQNWTRPITSSVRTTTWSKQLGLFLVTNSAGGLNYTSTDGVIWVTRTAPYTASAVSSSVWSPDLGIFCISYNNNRVCISSDGINWVSKSISINLYPWAWSPELGLFLGGTFTLPTNSVATSSDGLNWNTYVLPASGSGYNSLFGTWSSKLGLFVIPAYNTNSEIFTSSDGQNWKKTQTITGFIINNIQWIPDLEIFLACGDPSSKIYYSNDAISWTSIISANFLQIAYSPKLYKFVAPLYNSNDFISNDLKIDSLLSQYNKKTNIGTQNTSKVVIQGSEIILGQPYQNNVIYNGVSYKGLVYIRNEKPKGTAAGTITSGSWETNELNTISSYGLVDVTLDPSTFVFTLGPGTYEINSISALYASRLQSRLANTTDNSYIYGIDIVRSSSILNGFFSINDYKDYELQTRSIFTDYWGTATDVNGPDSVALNEIYSELILIRLI